ncbi:PepSY domain-containing protein [Ammoniphilus sp. 3BR4]|uniref:PepSY domain-containing protein n=1 Tax=Ammoniphilus sp. 3BR4 TaxID=3158265 RepID=UPI003466F77C
MRKRWIWMIFIILLAIVLFIPFRLWGGLNPSAETMSKEEVQEFIKNSYQGETTAIDLKGDQYLIEMNRENVLYNVALDAYTGEVLSLSRIDPKPEDQTEETPNPNNEQPKTLTEQEAAEIALKEVNGRVEDVDFETFNDNSFYLVEIETEDDREAVVQIHAITGKVLTITWDD